MSIHPLSSLGFEVAASLAELGFEPQLPIGMRETFSGRKVVQPTKSSAINQVLATEAMPGFMALLAAAIRSVPGATLAASRVVKNHHRLKEKITQQGQPAETVSDYGAAQIAVDSPQVKDRVVAAVRTHFDVLREQDYFSQGDPKYHYRHYSLQLQMPNGASEELQIIPLEVFQVNRQEHHQYKKARNAQLAGRSARAAIDAARAMNDGAMEQFNKSNTMVKGSVVKGSRVRLADGCSARVLYVDPNMRIARVRTQDGRNMTVRQKDLRC